MRFARLTKVMALGMAMAMMLTGCDLPFFKKSSRLAPEKVVEALDEYDSEGYDDLEEFEEDLENKRSLLSGMYITGEGKSIRRMLNSDAVDAIYEDVAEELVKELYTKSIEEAVLFVQSETDDKQGTVKFNIVSTRFESEDDAWKYYKNCNDRFSDLADDYDDTDLAREEDGDLECTMTKMQKARSAVCYSVSIEGSSVLVLTGYARRTNDLTDRMEELCEAISIPSADMSEWDLEIQTEAGDRTDLLMEEMDFEEVSPAEFDDMDDMPNGNYYTTTTDREHIKDLLSMDDEVIDDVEYMRVLYNRQSETSGVIVVSLKLCEGADADRFYDALKEEVIEDNVDYSTGGTGGEIDGIKFDISHINMFMNYIYAIYRENDVCYAIAATGSDNTNISDVFVQATDIMGLPNE